MQQEKMLHFCTSCPFQTPLHQIQVRGSIIITLWHHRFRYAFLFTESYTIPTPALPLSPLLCQERESALLRSQPQPPNIQQISRACDAFLKSITYTEEQTRLIEKATTTQRKSKRWYEERKYRITASNFGLVAKRKRNHCALARQLLYKRADNLSVAAVMWGQQHEIDAIRAYKKSLKPGLYVEEAGIFVSSCGFLGASPDGVVCNGEKRIKLIGQVSIQSTSGHCTWGLQQQYFLLLAWWQPATKAEGHTWVLFSNTGSNGDNQNSRVRLYHLDTKWHYCWNNCLMKNFG